LDNLTDKKFFIQSTRILIRNIQYQAGETRFVKIFFYVMKASPTYVT